jgi:hypothetical protein
MNDTRAQPADLTKVAGPATRRYSAFISYTDADRAKALKLQARLERYRLPPRLARQVGFNRVKPVFVDRSEMRAEPDLRDAVREALSHSDFLIVLCTPRTPKSRWVGIEIDAFRDLRSDANILVALFEGTKADSFHSHLLTGTGGRPADPLAADFRAKGDGARLALLKLMASLAGVNLDDLIHRDARRQRRFLMLAGGAVSLIALLVAVLSYTTYRAKTSEVQQRIEASRAMERQLGDLRAKIKAGGTLDMAAAVNRSVELFYDGQESSSQLPEVELGRAQLLQAKADDDVQRGEIGSAAENARSAWKISSDVLTREPSDTKAMFVHAQSAYWVGYSALLQGDTPLAANALARYADLADRLVKANSRKPDWQMERGYAYTNLGTIALQQARDPERAENYLETALAAFRAAGSRKPGDLDVTYELQNVYALLAGVGVLRNDHGAARNYRNTQAVLLAGMLARDPKNRLFLRDHLANELGLARLDAAQGNPASGLKRLRAAEHEATDLISADPESATFAGQKRAIELYEAQFELALSARDQLAHNRAEQLIGDCSQDWTKTGFDELATFCSILAAQDKLKRGDKAAAQQIMSDPRVKDRIRSRTLSTMMFLDFPAECSKLGDPTLCT